jgi:hypothetical protein
MEPEGVPDDVAVLAVRLNELSGGARPRSAD